MSIFDHLSRRNLCLMLPALAATAALADEEKSPLPSTVLRFEDLPSEGSGEYTAKQLLHGWTHEGFRVAMHESDLAPGGAPHPAHRHKHEEMFLVREGTLEVTIEGKSTKFGPGSAAYIASNDLHGVRNAGTTHAQYFVLELGTDD